MALGPGLGDHRLHLGPGRLQPGRRILLRPEPALGSGSLRLRRTIRKLRRDAVFGVRNLLTGVGQQPVGLGFRLGQHLVRRLVCTVQDPCRLLAQSRRQCLFVDDRISHPTLGFFELPPELVLSIGKCPQAFGDGFEVGPYFVGCESSPGGGEGVPRHFVGSQTR